MSKKQNGFIDYLYLLIKWRKLLLITFLIVCIAMVVWSLILPRWFTAETTIFPPIEEYGNLEFSSLLNKIPLGSLGLGMTPGSEQNAMLVAILDSRTVMDSIALKFNLQKRYKCKNLEKTVKTLRKRVKVVVNEEGTLTLRMKTKTPYFLSRKNDDGARVLSKNIANEFIAILDHINRKLKNERARNTRTFIESRYNETLDNLQAAEDSLARFQNIHGTVALPEQTAATIKAAAELKAQIMAKEVEQSVLVESVGKTNSEYLKIHKELEGLYKKNNDLFSGDKNKYLTDQGETKDNDVFIPLNNVADLAVQYARLYRDVLIQENLVEILLPEYENAKIQEAKNTPTIQVLDEAVLPIKKSAPKRAILVLAAGLLSLIVTFIYIILNDKYNEMRDNKSPEFQKIQSIKNLLKR